MNLRMSFYTVTDDQSGNHQCYLQYDSKPKSPRKAKSSNFQTSYKIRFVWESDLIWTLIYRVSQKNCSMFD